MQTSVSLLFGTEASTNSYCIH